MGLSNFKIPKEQGLCQRADRDCGVTVFAVLAGISYEDVLKDLPDADLGKVRVADWIAWLERRGHTVLRQEGCPAGIVPCAHLVASADHRDACHCIYWDRDGDIHDPSPVCRAMPADDERMRQLSIYPHKIPTLSV
jgi:hypothetical protein